MNELIKVTEQNGKQAVSARELHQFLIKDAKGGQEGQMFSHWIKDKIDFLELKENMDYQIIEFDYLGNVLAKNSKSENQDIRVHKRDYVLSIDSAKEISMVQSNDKGKQARQYFIECEKQLNKPKSQIELLLQSAQLLVEMERKQLALENRVQAIEQRPEVNGEIQHFSIMGYCRNIGKQISLNEAKTYGQKCSRFCTQMGFQTGKVLDPRFGTVKTYPLKVLEEIIGG